MRIVFDAQIFCAQRFGGISRYFASLTRELAEMDGFVPRIVAPLHVNNYAAHLPRALVVGRKVEWLGKARVAVGAMSCLLGELVQYKLRPDIVHRTYYYPQPRLPRSSRTIVSVYDMTYERFPQHFRTDDPVPRWKQAAVKRADHVVCISENTRRDVLELCDIAPERVSVTYLGYDSLATLLVQEDRAAARESLGGSNRPYLLYVGSRSGCKNFPALLRAFAGSHRLRQDFTLVCFGGGDFTAEEATLIGKLGAFQCVRHASGGDAALARAYRGAELFVYPSLYEGFGIPPLEAMSLDCPVACSNSSSLPEVVGEAAATFEPTDEDAIRDTLERTLESSTRRQELVALGRIRKNLFSWRRCALETAQIYRSLTA